MICPCGFSFIEARIADRNDFESYLVVADREYPGFLRRECEALAERNAHGRRRRIAEAARFAGSSMICPKCGRMLLVLPGAGTRIFAPEQRSTDPE